MRDDGFDVDLRLEWQMGMWSPSPAFGPDGGPPPTPTGPDFAIKEMRVASDYSLVRFSAHRISCGFWHIALGR